MSALCGSTTIRLIWRESRRPIFFQVAPPSSDLYTPSPEERSVRMSDSPVPAYMTLGFEGATTRAPIEAIGRPSKIGDHVTPASVVFQIPPPTEPKKKVAPSPGTPATATTRPPRNGPIILHCKPPKRSGETDWALVERFRGKTIRRKSSN